ncbi:helix-turn-helix domain-containing protein [Facklamia hominis]|uniref:helix-turn-helix domain-containing protein n=1 Tax=Facklamia hominis TaxID=178214 RepID=UPI0029D41924|nr:helix-turn-helix domain-containing protein [Facklamia hominis]WPJ90465.1 helix-turn-helix domain-containing protein [Facklamia hominis]
MNNFSSKHLNTSFMSLTVEDLLLNEEIKYIDYHSTKSGLLRKVENATIMDVRNISEYLRDYEVLMVGSYILDCLTEPFIINLSFKNISCIVTKIKYKSFITKNSLKLLDKYDIPIIFISNESPWSDIIIPIQTSIMDQKSDIIINNQNLFSDLISYLNNQHSLSNFCNIIYELTHLKLAIMNDNDQLIDYYDGINWHSFSIDFSKPTMVLQHLGNDINLNSIMGYIIEPNTLKNHAKIFIIPIKNTGNRLINYLLYSDNNFKKLPSDIISKLFIIDKVYSLKNTLLEEMKSSNLYYRNYIFNTLLKLDAPNKRIIDQLSLGLGQDIRNDCYCLIVSCGNGEEFNFIKKEFELENEIVQNTDISPTEPIVFQNKDSLVILIDGKTNYLKTICSNLYTHLTHKYPEENFFVSASNIHTYWEISIAYQEAQFCLNFVINNPNFKNEHIIFYKKLGVLKILINHDSQLNTLLIEELKKNFYDPIINYDLNYRTDLFNTLVIFFNNNLSYKKTSDILYIHVNTLRARIKTIEKILDLDIMSVDAIVNIRIMLILKLHNFF